MLMQKMSWGKIVVGVKCYAYYTYIALLPLHLGMYHTFCYTLGLSEKDNKHWGKVTPLFFAGLLLICVVLVGIVWGNSEVRLGLVWYTLFIAQWCNVRTLYQPIAERYLYLPNVGLMYVLAICIGHSPVAIGMWLTFYCTRLYYYLPAYKDGLTLFKANADNFPDLYNVYNSWGAELYFRGKVGAAVDAWIDGTQWKADDFKLNSNLAHALVKIGNIPMALHYLEMARKSINMTTAEVNLIPEYDKRIADCRKMMGDSITDTSTPLI